MSVPRYVFDSNIFINLQRFYPADIFSGLWAEIESLFDENTIVSSDEVIEEIIKGNDSLIDWIKERPDSFYKSDENIQIIVRDILKKYGTMVTAAKKPNAADPFVIALAKSLDCTLVSEEKKSGNEQFPKIPNVCDALHVRCIKFFEFFKRNENYIMKPIIATFCLLGVYI